MKIEKLVELEMAAGEWAIWCRDTDGLTDEKLAEVKQRYRLTESDESLVQDIFGLEVLRHVPRIPGGQYYFLGMRKKL